MKIGAKLYCRSVGTPVYVGRVRALAAISLLLLSGCSSDAPKTETKAAAPVLPVDESRWLPSKDQLSASVVPDHAIAPSLPPGGTVGDYKNARESWQLALVRMPSNDKAAFLLLDVRKAETNPQYLAHMGGYFGLSDGKPLYVFAKGPFVAAVKGLPMEQADPIARTFAARIPLQ